MPPWPLWPPLSAALTSPLRSRLPRCPLSLRHQCAVHCHQVVLAPSIAVAPHCPSPLRRQSLVDCCLFTLPPLLSRLPLPSPSLTLRHRHIILGEAIVTAVVVIIVLLSSRPPPAFRCRLLPLLIVIFPSILGIFTC